MSISWLFLTLCYSTHFFVELLDLHYGRGSINNFTTTNALRQTKSDPSLTMFDSLASHHHVNEDASPVGIAARKQSRQNVHDQERWGGRYAIAKSKLFLIVHNICGDALSSPLSQECLSILAACKSVAVLATVENLNSVSHWDRRVLSRYNWTYRHAATFEPARIPHDSFPLISGELNGLDGEAPEGDETVHVSEIDGSGERDQEDYFQTQPQDDDTSAIISTAPSRRPSKSSAQASNATQGVAMGPPSASSASGKGKGSKANGNAPQTAAAAEVAPSRAAVSLAAIKKSVTGNHNTVLEALVKAVLDKAAKLEKKRQLEEAPSSNTVRVKPVIAARPLHENGVPFRTFYNSLKGSLVVKSETMLRDLLKEFVDHAVIGYTYHQNEEFVYFKHPYTIHLQNNFVNKVMSLVSK